MDQQDKALAALERSRAGLMSESSTTATKYGYSSPSNVVPWNRSSSPVPTDYMGAVAYYQSLKTVYAFFTWQYFLISKDYMALFPEAYGKVDPKYKSFVDIAETYSCFYAFNEWHVSKMMGIATLTDPTSKMTQAQLASFYWDETFIYTVKTLMYFTLWSWSYPDQKWLTTSKPFIALSLPSSVPRRKRRHLR